MPPLLFAAQKIAQGEPVLVSPCTLIPLTRWLRGRRRSESVTELDSFNAPAPSLRAT